jgi:hypothetical protein
MFRSSWYHPRDVYITQVQKQKRLTIRNITIRILLFLLLLIPLLSGHYQLCNGKGKVNLITGPEATRFQVSQHTKVLRSSALRNGHLYTQEIFLVLISVTLARTVHWSSQTPDNLRFSRISHRCFGALPGQASGNYEDERLAAVWYVFVKILQSLIATTVDGSAQPNIGWGCVKGKATKVVLEKRATLNAARGRRTQPFWCLKTNREAPFFEEIQTPGLELRRPWWSCC